MKDFTPITPSADSRIIYVSSSEGNDSNPGTITHPVKSIRTGTDKMRKGYPDHVYLKRGDVWRETRILSGVQGRSITEPAVVAFYGTGPRPVVEANDKPIAIVNSAGVLKNVNIIGLHFYAYKMDPSHSEFDSTTHATVKIVCDNENLLFEDNIFDLTEITLEGYAGLNPKNITLRRNIWTGAYTNTSSYSQKSRPSNIYASRVDGLLLEENVLDHGGWHPNVEGASANMYNHNVYLQHDNVGDNVIVRNNIITRGSSHGVQMRAGGVASDNFFARNAIAVNFGYREKPISSGAIAHAFDNVITEGHSMLKGVNPNQGPNLCTGAVRGLDASTRELGNADWQSRGNLVHSHSPDDTGYKGIKSLIFHTLGETVVGWQEGAFNQGRTLADYNEALGGEHSFEAFMRKALNRSLQEWPEELTAESVNAYIRDGAVKALEQPSSTPGTESVPLATVESVTLAGLSSGKLEPVKKLESGVSIPEGIFNFIIDTTIGRIGSMGFNLTGPVNLERYENNAIYTVAEEGVGVNLLPGEYTLKSVVYSEPDMSGESGQEDIFTFSVVSPVADVLNSPVADAVPAEPEYITVEVTGTFKFKIIN